MSHRDSPIKTNKELSKPMDLMNVGFVGNVGSGGASVEQTGASFSQSGGYDYYRWLGNGSVTIIGYDVQAIVVGGGGGGTARFGGGGGGGGVIYTNVFTPPEGSQTVTVGSGGVRSVGGAVGNTGGSSSILV